MGFTGDDEVRADEGRGLLATVEFADREEESQALAASLQFMDDVLRDRRDISVFHHVLTYYGGGGVGKSSLSVRLQEWLEGKLVDDHWGEAPAVPNVRCVRWDLNGSQGEIDVVSMIMSLRAALPRVPGGWKFFDMALLSFVQSARPGEDLRIQAGKSEHGEALADAFQALADDVGSLLDFSTGIASQSVKALVALARRKYEQHQIKNFPRLARLIDNCNAQEASASPSSELAADVLRVLNYQLSTIKCPADRPLLVVFIDHFEKLQRDDRRVGEEALNRLVAALPQSLFVISGRNRLDWDDSARIWLPHHGPRTWPQLVPGARENPRQHRIGMLSEEDTRQVFLRRGARQGFSLDDDALARVVRRTGGWPLHIDAICILAAGESQGTGAPVPADVVDRPLDWVVRRVQENLTERQARAFRGACLLPYFDDALAAAAAGVDEGDVVSMRRHAMIEPSDDPKWPYRVHDTIRGVVRESSAEISGGWSPNDWKAAAKRAIDYVEGRFREAVAAENDIETVRAAALGIRIAAENDAWADWFVNPAITKTVHAAAPAEVLAPLLPAESKHPETSALLRYYAARVNRVHEESVKQLAEVADGDSLVARQARLWVAYKQRAAGLYDEAIEALRLLTVEHPWWRIPVGQIGITMNEARRFVDALVYAETIPENSQRYVRHNVCLNTGRLTDERVMSWESRTTGSTRFAVELLGARRVWEVRIGVAELSAIDATLVRAVNTGHLGAQRNSHFAHACMHLAHDDVVVADIRELETLDTRAVRPSSHQPQILALRALLTRSSADAERAFSLWQAAPVRNSSWLPVETYLLELGQPVVPDPTQWPEPEDVIRQRWLDIAQGIIERAKKAA
ncbi:MAG TPA: hypothetical protein PKE40_01130 [Arachnia sp.]|nr:hypothetical protein [Arachnia sp.]HMT84930.1 hypothetical protein [Arachnia sp.]